MFTDVAAMLDRSALVVRWDQRGCGRSERTGPYTLAGAVADVEDLRVHLGADRMILLGHSWGATLALLYTLRHPSRVAGLIYVSGTGIEPETAWKPSYEDTLRQRLGEDLGRWMDLKHAGLRSAAQDRELTMLQIAADFTDRRSAFQHAQRMATPYFAVNYASNQQLMAEGKRFIAEGAVVGLVRHLDMPVLIVDGRDDIRPRTAIDSLHHALRDVRRVTLAAGHVPWVEDPTGFAEVVTGFLLELKARPDSPPA